ncbi:MAG: penicillin-binding protein, partial [Aquificaceae bacterium]|nr:penicillin-binding protein [Aquificaceae bacterium]
MRRFTLIVSSFLAFFILFSGLFLFVLSLNLPPVEILKEWKPPVATVVYDAKDRPLGDVAIQRRYYVELKDIPNHLIQAFISAED